MENSDDRVFDEEQWKVEAEAVINDIKPHVKEIKLSTKLPTTSQRVYLNLTTLEELKFCVELSALGFSVVDNLHDSASKIEGKYFETPYSLLEHLSPRYSQSFGAMLFDKLRKLSAEPRIDQ